MGASVAVEIEGIEEFDRAAERLAFMTSPAALQSRVLFLANQAGMILKMASVQALVEEVYSRASTPLVSQELVPIHGGNADERSEDLLRSIRHVNEGFTQVIEVDPDMPVSSNAHAGRELVIDYAIAVHDGYVQWIPNGHGGSKNSGVFHPGRFWFNAALIEAEPALLTFLEIALEEMFTAVIEAL